MTTCKPATSTVSKDVLRRLALFADLDEPDLQQLYEMAETLVVPAGECFIEEGSPGDSLYVVIDGEVEITKREGNREVLLATRGSGNFIGEFALIERSPRSASVAAMCETRLLVISQAAFQTLLARSASAPLTILQTVIARLRSNESLLMQQKKMVALGTLAAGLAHELNNPAAALRRSAAHLHDALTESAAVAAELSALSLDAEQRATLLALREAGPVGDGAGADPLTRCDFEQQVEEWLDDQRVDRAWETAPVLVSCGWNRARLEPLSERFTPEQIAVVVRWLAAGSTTTALADELARSAEAISEIVTAVKSYAFLDQAPIQEIDVRESLESTLLILRHALGPGIQVTRDYADDLPRIEAYASELNQVWSNLLDNALDAMNGEGELTLRIRAAGDEVLVEIVDSGAGIPPEIQPRVFEPFFTTKEPGKGTGMGLHVAYNVVVERHRGKLELTSRPGETCFRVVLPLRIARS